MGGVRAGRRTPSQKFTYGLGRVEDLAGILIVLIILFSAVVAGYEAIDRLINRRPIAFLGWVAIAGIMGFVGNEAVAVFRIPVGREINSAALAIFAIVLQSSKAVLTSRSKRRT